MVRSHSSSPFALFRAPGLFVRLGWLIVLQGFFVFAGLALILFQPEESAVPANPQQETRHWLNDLGQRLADVGAQPVAPHIGRVAITSGHGDSLSSAGLIAVRPDGGLKCIANVDQAGVVVSSAQVPLVTGTFDQNLARVVAAQPPGFAILSIENSSTSTFYGRPESSRPEPMVFVAVVNHDYVISERGHLAYVVFILFLASTLVSLLTAYLLVKKVRDPLSRLSAGLEKTSTGEPTPQAVASEDGELSGLADSANRIAKTLREKQEKINEYDNRLQVAHAELAESQRFLSTLIDNSPSCVIAASPEGAVLLYNQEAQRTFGYAPGEVLGRPLSKLVTLPPDWPTVHVMPEKHHCEVLCSRKGQQQFPAFLVAAPIPDEDGRPSACLYILRDITESRGFQEMMVRLDRYTTRGEMAGEIAHEINNYLAVLSGNIELMPLLMRKGDQEKITKKLEMMRGTCDKIAKFTDGLMDGGPDETTFYPHNVNQIVENVLAFLKPQNKFDRVEFRTDLETELPQVAVDAGQIQQLLVNLVNNAADALADRKEGAAVVVRSRRADQNGEPAVRVQVHDNGPGVVADKVHLLFNTRFTTKKRGHGIGLITCKKIIDLHHGSITYCPDNGALFSIVLPVSVTAERVAPQPGEQMPAAGIPSQV
ncbi:hypothetical protein C3F09_00500 [candidate division GN15 bacterium]|uniref:histidine kinase n=1 Tax=candidate division GN15 bacterium TaxID=2072418 RepID=A0A855X4Z5_9BACT|nr:MAG: hypothetical protein C3F09_00500 [candidate division GN15 bacterium]